MKRAVCGFAVMVIFTFSLAAAGGSQQSTASSGGGAGRPKVSYYEALHRAGVGGHVSFATHPNWIELQKRLNIDIEFRHPATGAEIEGFNLLVASRDFPDIISYPWLGVPGGPGRYIQDDVIIRLNDVIDKWAPNLKKAYEKFPVAAKESIMDDGTRYLFPNMYSNVALATSFGPLVRKDLLAKVPGIDVSQFPSNMETLEEWEKILVAVKNSGLKGDSGRDIIPLAIHLEPDYFLSYFIVGAWNIGFRFTQENGKPVYGPADPRYREYLSLMRRWFELGLIDPEYPTNHLNGNQLLGEKILDNRAFAVAGWMGGISTRYHGLARPNNPAFTLATTKYPVLKKGELPNLAYRTFFYTGDGAAISTSAKNVEAAAKLLDYSYSDDGYILSNFGVEGVTFNWEPGDYVTQLITGAHPGYPRYTDLIMNNPDGYSKDVATGSIVRVGMYAGVKSPEFLEQRDNLPEQVGPLGRELWMAASNKNTMPAVTPTEEESSEMARIMTDINTYADEMTIKFISGAEPLNDARWNEYVSTIQRMGLERALAITAAQIQRYNNRKL